ncbi:hypothetical protein [Paenisporosarcina sp. TG20]|uniref:hypothetical protein n=1 Tax=Paenisporosarcina sp. TG20 TaxID=1211706 RepID=UPI00030F58DF|nr:hypothetical protein [Paenisporosarcina sp. TG20]
MSAETIRFQTIASTVSHVVEKNLKDVQVKILEQGILVKELLSIQDERFMDALTEVSKVRTFLSNPARILGSERTKHGEVAEQVEVYIRNAREFINGNERIATFDGVARTAPEDYILNGLKVQSKFINGTNNSLDHVIKHLEKYDGFTDGGARYILPKDQYDIIQRIYQGEQVEGLNARSIVSILEKIKDIEERTGKPFGQVVDGSISNYGDVQLGKIHDTLNDHEQNIMQTNDQKKSEIRKKTEEEKNRLNELKQPSLNEGLKVAGIAGLVGGGMSFATAVYKKHKLGIPIHQFASEEWKEVGIDSAKGAGKASVTAGAIYAATRLTDMSAPMAGAVASASWGMARLIGQYSENEINLDEFIEQGQVVCLDAGIAALGAGLGQFLIPIPILGAIIGTIATDVLWGIAKGKIGTAEIEFRAKLDAYYAKVKQELEEEYSRIVTKIREHYERLGGIIHAAFDLQFNLDTRFGNSILLAQDLSVEEDKILKTEEDIMRFFID